MVCDITWLIGRSLSEVILAPDSSWCFRFDDSTLIRADSPWRLIRDGRIARSSEDHGHQFGLPEPIDAEAECRSLISGAIVQAAEIRDGTRDIVIVFESGDMLEILPLSSGYESWQVSAPGGAMIIAQGGGNLVKWD